MFPNSLPKGVRILLILTNRASTCRLAPGVDTNFSSILLRVENSEGTSPFDRSSPSKLAIKVYNLVNRTPGDLIQYNLVNRTPGDLIQYNLVNRTPGDLIQYNLVNRTPGDLIQYNLVNRTPGDLIQYNLVNRTPGDC